MTDPRESVNPVIDVMSDSSAYRLTNLLVPYISGYTQDVSGHLPGTFLILARKAPSTSLSFTSDAPTLRSAEDSTLLVAALTRSPTRPAPYEEGVERITR